MAEPRVTLAMTVPDVGREPGTEFALDDALSIGRDDACDITLNDLSASRRHAEVRFGPTGDVLVADLGSSNGVWVGDDKISEAVLGDRDRFRIGEVEFEVRIQRPSIAHVTSVGDLDPIPRTHAFATPPKSLDEAFAVAGVREVVSGNAPFLLKGQDNVWIVTSGKIEIFLVPVEGDRYSGPRRHVATVYPDKLFFALGSADVFDYGFLAVGAINTTVYRLHWDILRGLVAEGALTDAIGGALDEWIELVSRAVSERRPIEPTAPTAMAAGETASVDQQPSTAGHGVVWVDMLEGDLLLNETLALFGGAAGPKPLKGRQASLGTAVRSILRQGADRRPLFPITDETSITASNSGGTPTTVAVTATPDVIDDERMWDGLRAFHDHASRLALQMRSIEDFEESVRVVSYERERMKAEQEADSLLKTVLQNLPKHEAEARLAKQTDPVFAACKMVGDALGIEVIEHPDSRRGQFIERVDAMSKTSGFRTRVVALRDDWWTLDQGPILARLERGDEPVALLPKGPTAYRAALPQRGQSVDVDEAFAGLLKPFGLVFYPSLPDGPIEATDLLRFGAKGLARELWWLAAMGVGLGLAGTLTPVLTGMLFDTAIPEAERGLVFQFAAAILIVAFVSAAFRVVRSIAVLRLQGKMDYKLQAAVWDRLLNLPAGFFKDYDSGDLADRAQGINEIRGLVAGAGVNSILGSLSSVFYVGLLFFYDWRMALLAIALTIAFVAVSSIYNYRQLRHQRTLMTVQGKIAGLVLQLISGLSKLRVSGAENHAFRLWAEQFARQRRIEFSIGRLQNTVEIFNAGFPVLASVAIFALTIKLTQSSETASRMSTGQFIAFTTAYGAFQAATLALSQASLDLVQVFPVYERIRPILTTPAEVDQGKSYPGTLRGQIDVSRVSFRYSPDGPLILNNLSLTIEPGEMVAFVGESGSGKSTLMRVLLGFETPEQGSVNYDGQNLVELDIRAVRQQIGVVLQNSQLLPAELYRNIIGSANLTMADAWDAARLAGLADDIEDMPMGMHTYVSEGGGGLSGGQKQRLLIARALVRKPRILFFDEATSALDNRSQAVVTESMDRLKATRIVIAHRLSTILNADRIYYLKNGQVAESGTYQELMQQDGLFAALAKRQLA